MNDWAFDSFEPREVYLPEYESEYKLVTFCNMASNITYRMLALDIVVNLISNLMSLSQFDFYNGNKIDRKNKFNYILNYEPNQNENASVFWKGVITQLLKTNTALVVVYNDKLYLAKDYEMDKLALKPNYYRNVQIDDKFTFTEKAFTEREVLHFKFNDRNITQLLNKLLKDWDDLINFAQDVYYKNNTQRAVLNVPATYPQTDKHQESLQTLIEKRLEPFFNSKTGGAIPLTNDIELEYLVNSSYNNSSNSDDIKKIWDRILSVTAIAFNVPPQLLIGNVADTQNSLDNMLDLCIRPLSEMIEDELNRKIFGRKVLSGKRIIVNTHNIIKADITELAGAIDILTRNSVNTIDDNLEMLGRERIEEEWSQMRFATKNYMPLDDWVEESKLSYIEKSNKLREESHVDDSNDKEGNN